MRSKVVASILFLACSTMGAVYSANAADKCDEIYKKYPITNNCHGNQMCLQQNMENRQARIAAGCKATRNYKY